MILFVDVNYRKEGAFAAGVIARTWTDAFAEFEKVLYLSKAEDYIPGSFYLRELPCILELLKRIPKMPNIIVIDGYVTLGSDKKDGLGMHLFKAISYKAAVVGVAKSKFKDTPEDSKVYRGRSLRPLFITSAGIDQEEAKRHIAEMHGPDRIPTLIKKADQLSRHLIIS